MNGRKRIIVIMIILFGLLMTTGVSTWIITSQVTFAPGYYDGPVVTTVIPTLSNVDINFGDLDANSPTGLKNKVIEKITQKDDGTNTGKLVSTQEFLTFKDEATGAPISWETLGITAANINVNTISLTDGNTTTSTSAYAVGSTYYCTLDISLPENGNYVFKDDKKPSCIVKYKTCKVNGIWFTIEDALKQNEVISTAGGTPSGTIQTTFSRLANINVGVTTQAAAFAAIKSKFGTYLTNYNFSNNKYNYDLNNVLFVPHKDVSYTDDVELESASGSNIVYSGLNIPQNINLTVKSSGKIAVGAKVGNGGETYDRGVIINNGLITAQSGSYINSYGYIKGSQGNLVLESKANAMDVFRMYDFSGGGHTLSVKNANVFPINVYSFHNISCKTRINSGSTYKAYYYIDMDPSPQSGSVNVLGPSDALFSLQSGYIEKTTAFTYAVGAKNPNDDYTTRNTLPKTQRDKVTIHGVADDNSISVADGNLKTSTTIALPISAMEIIVGEGSSLTLEANSYKFYPGTSAKVEKNATLTVKSGVKTFFYDGTTYAEYCSVTKPSATTASSDGTSWTVSGKDAYVENNGYICYESGSYISGTATTGSEGAIFEILGNTSCTMLRISNYPYTGSTSDKLAVLAGTLKATSVDGMSLPLMGDLIYYQIGTTLYDKTIENVQEETIANSTLKQLVDNTIPKLTQGAYTSVKVGNKYYWAKNEIFATVSAVDENGAASTENDVNKAYDPGKAITWDMLNKAGFTQVTSATLSGFDGTNNAISATWTSQKNEDGTISVFVDGSQIDPSQTSVCAFADFALAAIVDPTAVSYKITYNTNYQSGATNTATPVIVKVSQSANTVDDIGKDDNGRDLAFSDVGYKFKGWSTSVNGSIIDGTSIPTTSFTTESELKTIQLFAIWEKLHHITFNVNTDGVTKPAALDNIYHDIAGDGAQFTLPNVTLNKEGYKFLGWATSADATTAIEQSTTLTGANGGTTELFAVWKQLWKITYDANGGTVDPAYEYHDFDELDEFTPAIPTREDYLFNGWLYSDGTPCVVVTKAFFDGAKELTLKATWENNFVIYLNDEKSPIQPDKDGWTVVKIENTTTQEFKGWSLTENTTDGTIKADKLSIAELEALADDNKEIRLYAAWLDWPKIDATAVENLASNTSISVSGKNVNKSDNNEKVWYVHNREKTLITVKFTVNDRWNTQPDVTGDITEKTVTKSTDNELAVTITFYINSTGTAEIVGKGNCIAAGSLITLADGSQKKVEDLTGEEMLLVWNTFTGQFESAPILFVDSEPLAEYRIVNLNFADGTTVKVIYEHGFFDVNLNKYVYIDEYNASEFIGHEFIKQTYDENGDMVQVKVALTSVIVTTEQTTAWSPVTYQHLCYYVDGMLSMPGGIEGLFNIFEIDTETMTIDKEQMAKDIEKYGLFTYDEFNAILPLNEVMFEVFNGEYLKVALGKGLITWERLEYLVNRYSVFFEEQ